jgi:hypothetical protein
MSTRWEATQSVMAAKLTRLTHKSAIQLNMVAESCTICSSRSRRPVRKLLVTPSMTSTSQGSNKTLPHSSHWISRLAHYYLWFVLRKSRVRFSSRRLNIMTFLVTFVSPSREILEHYIQTDRDSSLLHPFSCSKSIKTTGFLNMSIIWYSRPVFLNRRAAARYRALGQWSITNLNVILYLSTCHTVHVSVLILFMIMP